MMFARLCQTTIVMEFLVICRNDDSRMRVMGRTLSIRKSPLNETRSIPRGAVQLLETHGHSTRQKTLPAF